MDNTKVLLQTCCFAAEKHKNQRRRDPESTPYINHPLGVAKILVEAGVHNLHTLQAAILHDTVEDTETSFEELEATFGKEVCSIVKEVTDDKDLSKEERKRLQVENAPHKSFEAKLVKLADKIYNLRDLQRALPAGWTQQRSMEYFQWAEKVTDGLGKGNNSVLEAELEAIYSKGI